MKQYQRVRHYHKWKANTRPLEYGLGIVVHEVSKELNFDDKDIEDTPAFGTKLEINDILGMAKSEGGVRILLYIDRVLCGEEKTL